MALMRGAGSFLVPRENIAAVAQGRALQPEDCGSIINYCLKFPIEEAVISGDQKLNHKIRKNFVRWIPWDSETEKIFTLIRNVAYESNAKFWNMELAGFGEPIQLTHYTGAGDHYDWHTDLGEGVLSLRKLTVIIQLTDPSEYEGGDVIMRGATEIIANKDQGNMIMFPSWMPHCVMPITKGERFSLVVWISGPPFK